MSLRDDINGLRVKLTTHPAIYLMDQGKKRHIPNPDVYNKIFRNWEGIIEELSVTNIPAGDPIPVYAKLVKLEDSPAVYLIDEQGGKKVKRHVTSPAVLDRYHFDWDKIESETVSHSEYGIPNGPPITNPF